MGVRNLKLEADNRATARAVHRARLVALLTDDTIARAETTIGTSLQVLKRHPVWNYGPGWMGCRPPDDWEPSDFFPRRLFDLSKDVSEATDLSEN
jgi:hypothetical protein